MTALPRETPVVSVVMPAFNAAGTLQVAIDSTLSQTLTNLELLIGDDASTDETSALLATIKDPRVRVFTNASNLGPGPTRDHLIAQASGKWIAFLDADDTMHPGRLSQLISHAEQRLPCIIFDDMLSCHDTPLGLRPWKRLRGANAFGANSQPQLVTIASFVSQDRLVMQPIVPTEFLRKSGVSHLKLPMGEDANFVLKLAARGLPMFYVPEALYRYRIAAGSLTKARDRHQNMAVALEGLLNEKGLTDQDRLSIEEKIFELRRSHQYSEFIELVKARRIIQAFCKVSRSPWLILRLAKRVVRGQLHHLHRRLSIYLNRDLS